MKYVILVNEMDDKGRIKKLHTGTYDHETALEIYNNKKADGWQVFMESEIKFKINRMHEMAKELDKYTYSI